MSFCFYRARLRSGVNGIDTKLDEAMYCTNSS